MTKRILLIRTFKDVGAGGPVIPLGLLYLASSIRARFGDKCQIKIIDTGIIGEDLDILRTEINVFKPQIIGLSAITCEAGLMHDIARVAKEMGKNITVLAGGPHPTIVSESVLSDSNIDYAIIGEGERTVVDLLEGLENGQDRSRIKGIGYMDNNRHVLTEPQGYIDNLDDIAFPAWDLVNFREYAKYPNWNGNLKEKYYMPVLTSRGCPYLCTYCHNTLGKKFRPRTAENVFSEITSLYRGYQIKEFHIFDDVFNFDNNRIKKLCQYIVDSKLKLSFAFPNGLRLDIMDKETVNLLHKIGTYKINYAVETASLKTQRTIKKNLDLGKVKEVVYNTNKLGIITTGYFMLGFPNETKDDMLETIRFAAVSDFDLAYFFKATAFPGTELFKSVTDKNIEESGLDYYKEAYFSSREYSISSIPTEELNRLVLYAQKEFYFKAKRIWRLIFKSPYKLKTLKNLFELWTKILISSIEI